MNITRNICISIFIAWLSSFQLYGQCYPDRHSTNVHDGWVSCSISPHPISEIDDHHWIMYDFGKVNKMYSSKVWNLNSPEHLDWNTKEALIHYSKDGIKWKSLGNFKFDQATGDPLYQGTKGPDFDGLKARFLVITPISNYGGECYGLGEIRIYTEPNI